MEWAPKFLDNLDSSAIALYQFWAGYYRWVFLHLVMTTVAVIAMTASPAIRLLAIAVVTTYCSLESIDRFVSRRKHRRRAAAARG